MSLGDWLRGLNPFEAELPEVLEKLPGPTRRALASVLRELAQGDLPQEEFRRRWEALAGGRGWGGAMERVEEAAADFIRLRDAREDGFPRGAQAGEPATEQLLGIKRQVLFSHIRLLEHRAGTDLPIAAGRPAPEGPLPRPSAAPGVNPDELPKPDTNAGNRERWKPE